MLVTGVFVLFAAGGPRAAAGVGEPLVGGEPAPPPAPPVEEILSRVREANGAQPPYLRFRQDVELRAFFLRWRFSSQVVQEGGERRIRVEGAPSFVPEDLSTAVLEASESLDRFSFRLVERTAGLQGEPVYVLEGEPRQAEGGGPEWSRVWVNGQTWWIDKVEVRYPWGTLTVEQRFTQVQGYRLLAEQQATLGSGGIRLRILDRDYGFGP